MKYYVVSDIHGFYSLFIETLEKAGYFEDKDSHKLLILGDLFDRGKEALQLQDYIIRLIGNDEVILVKGNHEDLFNELVTTDQGLPYNHHIHNGTFDTAMQLTGFDLDLSLKRNTFFAAAAKDTPYYKKIIPAMRDYYETENYIFVHGWIPCCCERGLYSRIFDWRNAEKTDWIDARWQNGMDAVQTVREEKTIVCGHWHTSYGHSKYENRGSEFGSDADFSPYYADGIIAIDACTGFSGKVNCIVVED